MEIPPPGYSHGVRWDKALVERLRDLKMRGASNVDIAVILSDESGQDISTDSVSQACKRHKLTGRYLQKDNYIPHYETYPIPEGDYIVTCDYHAPFHSELWVNRMVAIAKKFKVKKQIIVGDLFDFDWIKHFFSPTPRSLDLEVHSTRPMLEYLMGWFEKIYLIEGNHERRVARQTGERFAAKHVIGNFSPADWDKVFEYIEADKAEMGDYLFIHPKSYSQISGSVAVRLAEKYRKNICNAHGHFAALRYDRSGENLAADIGGMFDIDKVSYINLFTTTHPFWNNGFAMIRNEEMHMFHEKSPWKFYLGRKG